jgi:hypothetical protein
MIPDTQVQSENLPSRLFGVPTTLSSADAAALQTSLQEIRNAQFGTLPSSVRYRSDAPLREELETARYWFDPVAKGERIRDALALLPRLRVSIPHESPEIVIIVPDARGDEIGTPGTRMLLTPEGIAILHCVNRARRNALRNGALPGDPVQFDASAVNDSLVTLSRTYQRWTRQRVNQTIALLTSEPSTLRPAAAGLLLVLLVNRNTAPERALPRPSDRYQLDTISAAIGAPALAYARTLSGSDRASLSGVDLYRGWALGELTRRLGASLHTGIDEGIYLEPDAEAEALRRLADDISRRPQAARARAGAAVDAALREYEAVRPVLAGLALAHDRPSNTERIRAVLGTAAGRSLMEGM